MCYPDMVTLSRAPALIRRLAAILTLLAVAVLVLHEGAQAANMLAVDGRSPLAGAVQLNAPADPDDSGFGGHRQSWAVPHSCHVCGVVLPMAPAGDAVFVSRTVRLAAALATEHPGLDPGGPRRPPRPSVIA